MNSTRLKPRARGQDALATGVWAGPQTALTAGDRADDEERFGARRDGVGQRVVGRVVREVFLAGEEPQHRATLPGYVVADRALEHREAVLERVEDRGGRHRAKHVEPHLALLDVRQ